MSSLTKIPCKSLRRRQTWITSRKRSAARGIAINPKQELRSSSTHYGVVGESEFRFPEQGDSRSSGLSMYKSYGLFTSSFQPKEKSQTN